MISVRMQQNGKVLIQFVLNSGDRPLTALGFKCRNTGNRQAKPAICTEYYYLRDSLRTLGKNVD